MLNMPADYIPILILLAFALGLAVAFVIISAILGRPKKQKTVLEPYECGVDQAMAPRRPLAIKFFIVAIIFLLFDVEVALLYPWAALFRKFVEGGAGRFIIIEGFVFLAVLAIGLVYVFRVGALEWEE